MSEPGRGRRKGLGRGLSALLDEEPDDQATLDRLRGSRTAAIDRLIPNRLQPRRIFAEDELQELVSSILSKGILMPILVRRSASEDADYEIVAGERRWRAAQLAQLHDVPIIVKDLDDTEALEVALVENIQRQNLTPLEEAEGFRRLLDDFAHTQEAIAETVGKSRSHVANTLRLLNLPDAVKKLLDRGQLSAGHGRALLAAKDAVGLADKVMAGGLNVRATERLVKRTNQTAEGAAAAKPTAAAKDADARALEKQLSQRLGLKVTLRHAGERGEVRIAFRSLEQFDEIVARLNRDPAEN